MTDELESGVGAAEYDDFPDLPDEEVIQLIEGRHALSAQYGFSSQPVEESDNEVGTEEDETAQELEDDDAEQPDVEEDTEADVEQPEEGEQDDGEEQDTDSETEDEPKAEEPTPDGVTLEDLLKPIKANGGTIQVRSPADAKRLIQMGANYSSKMAQLKPHLRTVKMLEQNGMLEDPDRMNLMVEAFNGNKQAITKLFADMDIDPLDVDLEDAKDYKSNDYRVSEQDYELHTTLSELSLQPQFGRVTELVKGWDTVSQNMIAENPTILEGISTIAGNDEAFTKIMEEVHTLRTLGEVPAGIPDVDVFGYIAQQHYAAMGEATKTTQSPSEVAKKSEQEAKQKKAVQRKKAIAPTRGVTRPSAEPQITVDDLMSMSDEEFAKLAPDNLFAKLN